MKLVILDRDGVINHDSEHYIRSPDDWHPIPGSLDAIARLCHAGYRIVVITNQAGIDRNLFDLEHLNRIHEKMHNCVRAAGGQIDAIEFCTSSDDRHPCRKPNPGMHLELAARLSISLDGIPAIGDALRDIQAARAAGAQPVLVRTGRGALTMRDHYHELRNVPIYDDLAAAARHIVRTT